MTPVGSARSDRAAGRVWYRGLFVRVFGLAALVALLAVAAATWATVRSTTVAVEQEQRESLQADARVYDALVGYAAGHRSWAGAAGLVARLARQSGQEVAVTDRTGHALVDSAHGSAVRRPAGARATLDPLAVDQALGSLAGGATAGPASTATTPTRSLKPCAVSPAAAVPDGCASFVVEPTTAVDARVLARAAPATAKRFWVAVQRHVDRCLQRRGLRPVSAVRRDLGVVVGYADRHTAVAACADRAGRAQLARRVAPPALLFLGGPGGTPTASAFHDLTAGGKVRIVVVAGGVLVVTLALCALLAGSIVRPLRRLGETARRASRGDLTARVGYHRADEIGDVARAFDEMAERRVALEEARRRLVSDVSHDLRTPVSTVRGWLEAAQDGLVEPDAALLAGLHEETLHLQHLVEDLHQVALGDAGRLDLRREPVDLVALVGQVVATFALAAARADVALSARPGPPAYVAADPVRLRQALDNVVGNALRHTPAGGRIELAATGRTLTVADTGEGIPAEDLPHVFDRFRRVDASRSRLTGGSGLGLAIVRQIAEAHGGTATIASAPGTGTTVTLRL